MGPAERSRIRRVKIGKTRSAVVTPQETSWAQIARLIFEGRLVDAINGSAKSTCRIESGRQLSAEPGEIALVHLLGLLVNGFLQGRSAVQDQCLVVVGRVV